MKTTTKYIMASIIIISIILVASAANRNPNDYYAMMGQFNDIKTTETDELNVTFPVYYIPLSAGATYIMTANGTQQQVYYNLTIMPVTATVNLSQPAQINNKIQVAINNTAAKKGYNLKKIIMQAYNIVNPP